MFVKMGSNLPQSRDEHNKIFELPPPTVVLVSTVGCAMRIAYLHNLKSHIHKWFVSAEEHGGHLTTGLRTDQMLLMMLMMNMMTQMHRKYGLFTYKL